MAATYNANLFFFFIHTTRGNSHKTCLELATMSGPTSTGNIKEEHNITSSYYNLSQCNLLSKILSHSHHHNANVAWETRENRHHLGHELVDLPGEKPKRISSLPMHTDYTHRRPITPALLKINLKPLLIHTQKSTVCRKSSMPRPKSQPGISRKSSPMSRSMSSSRSSSAKSPSSRSCSPSK